MKTCSVVLDDTPEIEGQCSFFFTSQAPKTPATRRNICHYNTKKHKPETERNKREIKKESVVVDVVRFKSAGRETKNEEWMQAI